ncbi:MAG: YHS domain-containing protein [Acidobacteria bacterium]|nr:YHS domain-containing protein [Acidobacteriota bacterium]
MLTLLWRLLIFIAAIFMIRAFLAMIFGGGQIRKRDGSSKRAGEPEAKKMVKDPVCGMYMDPRLALHLKERGGDFYFCSEECRRKFLSGTSAHP